MAKPNYSFAKRQRDLAKEQKKEEKLQRKKAAADEEVGARTNIGAGTITCNYDGVNKWKTVLVRGYQL